MMHLNVSIQITVLQTEHILPHRYLLGLKDRAALTGDRHILYHLLTSQ